MPFALQIVWLIVFTFGAPAFTVLACSYWRQRRNSSTTFRVFTLLCAVSFVASLVSAAVYIDYFPIHAARSLVAALLPPMMAHLVLEQEGIGRAPLWGSLLWLLYTVAVASAIGRELSSTEVFDISLPLVLIAASVLSLAALLTNTRERAAGTRQHRIWNLSLFTALLFSAVAALLSDNTFFELAPDYLLLLFFAVRLYYSERLVFFDTFMKGGSYFAAGVILLALLLLALPSFREDFASDWLQAWLGILLLMPVWLLGPLFYRLLNRWTDRALNRKYSAIRAERLFMQAAQAASSEEELRTIAEDSFREIFHCAVEADFDGTSATTSPDDLVCALTPAGRVRLLARASQIPFLSADARLLEALTANLSVLLQNVRLRVQQQEQILREQELESLASRAELRALRAQIDPHFLFNALNAIAGWIRTEPEFADDTVAQLAEVFRYTLRRSQKEWVRVQEEVDFIRAYLAVERARFGQRLVTEISMDPATQDVSVPAMLIQPLIENAIKHGVARVAATGRISLSVRLEEDELRIEVSDNGAGFPEGFMLAAASGHGLKSVTDRLRGYYGDSAVLRWTNAATGCLVSINVPCGAEL